MCSYIKVLKNDKLFFIQFQGPLPPTDAHPNKLYLLAPHTDLCVSRQKVHVFPEHFVSCLFPANTKYLNNVYTTSTQRLRRWSNTNVLLGYI